MNKNNDNKYTMFKLVREYLTEYMPDIRNCSSYTITLYRQIINNFFEFAALKNNVCLQELDMSIFSSDMVKAFILHKKNVDLCSPATCNIYITALRSFVNYATTRKRTFLDLAIDLNSIPKMKSPVDLTVRHFSKEALLAMLEVPKCNTQIGRRNFLIMFMLYETAARLSELLNLRMKDLVLETRTPFVILHGKGNKIRNVPITSRCVKMVKDYVLENGLDAHSDMCLFYSRESDVYNCLSSDSVQKTIVNIAKEARLHCPSVPEKVTPHMFRHSRAMHLYEDGVPLTMVQQLLGHSNLDTTYIYAYASTEMKREAIDKATVDLSSIIDRKKGEFDPRLMDLERFKAEFSLKEVKIKTE